MFYRTVFKVEVLSRGQLPDGISLEGLDYAITEGDCSGNVEVSEEQVDGTYMVALLTSQGSDPAFLGLNEDGSEANE